MPRKRLPRRTVTLIVTMEVHRGPTLRQIARRTKLAIMEQANWPTPPGTPYHAEGPFHLKVRPA